MSLSDISCSRPDPKDKCEERERERERERRRGKREDQCQQARKICLLSKLEIHGFLLF